MSFLKKKNCAKTTLSSAMTTNQTTMTVSDASVFPSSGDFLVTIWNKNSYADPCNDPNMEIVRVTGVSGNILTITRAQESTIGAVHSGSHAVEQLITAGTFEDIETAIDGKSDLSHTHNAEDIATNISGENVQESLDSKLSNLSEDSTPQLGGELDSQDNSIGFTLQSLTIEPGGASTIDWRNGNKAEITLDENITFTFTDPSKPCNLLIKIIQDATGSRTITWPASVKWPSGTAPTLTTDANSVDIVSLFFDGTNYYGVASLDFE